MGRPLTIILLSVAAVLLLPPAPGHAAAVWEAEATAGFGAGEANPLAMPIVEFNGKLYAGVASEDGAQIQVRETPAGGWSPFMTDSFGDTGNAAVVRMIEYGGYLYAGTANIEDGCGVWRWDGVDGHAWENALSLTGGGGAGFGSSDNIAVTAMAVYDGELYVGVTNYSLEFSLSPFQLPSTAGPSVYGFDGTSWSSTGVPSDFPSSTTYPNCGIGSLEAYGGRLYACTIRFRLDYNIWSSPVPVSVIGNGCDLFSCDETGWELEAKLSSPSNGMDNLTALDMAVYDGNLLIGMTNGKITADLTLANMSVDNIGFDSNGLMVYEYDGVNSPTAMVSGGFGSAEDMAVVCMEQAIVDGVSVLMAGTAAPEGTGKLEKFDGTTWSGMAADGFENIENLGITALAAVESEESADSAIYAGTLNLEEGCEVWRGSHAYGITVTQGAHGSITPAGISGVVAVESGASQAFNITPDTGYHTADVIVDGTTHLGAVSSYTFTNVTSDHTIAACFAESGAPSSIWYLAEGSTDWGFDCYISIENPNSEAVHVDLTYMTGNGAVGGPEVAMPAMSQATVFPRETLGADDFSTMVECRETSDISVDRTMYWTGQGAPCPEAHCATGVTAPAGTWYMPEGCSDYGFECFLLIQNPNGTAAGCGITWMLEGEAPVTEQVTVGASSRATYNMADSIGAKNASIRVDADLPVICERAMYRNGRREGHDSCGTTTPAVDYYLAEGCTGFGFTTYVLVQNPQDTPTNVAVSYQAASGPVVGPAFQMPANSRKTICVNETTAIPGDDPSFSTRVQGSQPIIAERAMYWNGGADSAQVCHDSIGLDQPHASWYLADGQTSEGRETWTLVQNPNDTGITVEITYMTPDGTGNVVKIEKIAENSRRTFNMAEHSGLNGRAAIMVKCTTPGKKIMVERAMYWNDRGTGTDTIGGYAD